MEPPTDEEIRELILKAVGQQMSNAMNVYISNHATDPGTAATKLQRAMSNIKTAAREMVYVIDDMKQEETQL